MLKEGVRTCDVCGERIPSGTKFGVRTAPQEKTEMVRATLRADPLTRDMSWRENPDGSLSLDMCTVCYLSMDTETKGSVH